MVRTVYCQIPSSLYVQKRHDMFTYYRSDSNIVWGVCVCVYVVIQLSRDQHMQLVLNWCHAVCTVSSYIRQLCPKLTSWQQLHHSPHIHSIYRHRHRSSTFLFLKGHYCGRYGCRKKGSLTFPPYLEIWGKKGRKYFHLNIWVIILQTDSPQCNWYEISIMLKGLGNLGFSIHFDCFLSEFLD